MQQESFSSNQLLEYSVPVHYRILIWHLTTVRSTRILKLQCKILTTMEDQRAQARPLSLKKRNGFNTTTRYFPTIRIHIWWPQTRHTGLSSIRCFRSQNQELERELNWKIIYFDIKDYNNMMKKFCSKDQAGGVSTWPQPSNLVGCSVWMQYKVALKDVFKEQQYTYVSSINNQYIRTCLDIKFW